MSYRGKFLMLHTKKIKRILYYIRITFASRLLSAETEFLMRKIICCAVRLEVIGDNVTFIAQNKVLKIFA